jgi:hypothetical protein
MNRFLGSVQPQRLRKNSMLQLVLGGAALHRCDSGIVLNPALAAEVALSAGNDFFRKLLSRVGFFSPCPISLSDTFPAYLPPHRTLNKY